MNRALKKYISIIVWPVIIGVIVLLFRLYYQQELTTENIFRVIITALIVGIFLLFMYFVFKGIQHLLRNKTR